MKTFKYIYTVLLALFVFNACTDEVEMPNQPNVVEGIPVNATFTFGTDDFTVITKASGDDNVNDLYVVVFSETGRHEGSHFFSSNSNYGGAPLNKITTHSGTVTISTTSGTKYLYAVANVKSKNFDSSDTNKDLKALLDEDAWKNSGDATDLENWKAYSAAMVAENMEWSATSLLMTGRYNKKADEYEGSANRSGKCIIGTNGSVTLEGGGEGKIWLARAVASITFNFHEGKGVTFEPLSYQIYNVPKDVYMYDDGVGTDTNKPYQTGFFNQPNARQIANNTFQFYMLENRQADRTATSTETRATYAFQDGFPGTYLIIRGNYKGNEDNPITGTKDQEATAEVTYRIPLGYAKGANDVAKATDFSVRRNYAYTYNVTVNGVNDIIVEASTDKEIDGPDGDVYFTDGMNVIADAHYNRFAIKFAAGQSLVNEGKLVCTVKTAKTGKSEMRIDEPGADIDWVYFVEKTVVDGLWANNGKSPDFATKKTNPNSTNMDVACIMDINQLSANLSNASHSYYTNGVEVYVYIKEHFYEEDERSYAGGTLNLSDFVCYSATGVADKTRSMKIALQTMKGANSTVYSAKYVISQKPIITFYDIASLKGQAWGMECLNENLAPGYYNEETDLITKSFKYGLPFGTLPTGAPALYGDGSNNNYSESRIRYSKDDGKTGQQEMLGNVTTWKALETNRYAKLFGFYDESTHYIHHHTTPATSTNYEAKAFAACMSRNRDENGDGVITNDEIKWYLPAINQYEHFWIGSDAVPEEALLLPREFRNATINQMNPSPSAYTAYRPNGTVIEEANLGTAPMYSYVSVGGFRYQADESFGTIPNSWARYDGRGVFNHIRCARNLGNSGTNASIAKSKTVGSTIVIDAGNLTSVSLREPANGQLAPHNEHNDLNRLTAHFEIDKTPINTGKAYAVLAEEVRDGSDPCATARGAGWRIPNQRELIFISTVCSTSDFGRDVFSNLYTNTFSYLWDYEKWERHQQRYEVGTDEISARYGYYYSGGHLALQTTRNNGPEMNILCVRDR